MAGLKNEKIEILIAEINFNDKVLFHSFLDLFTTAQSRESLLNKINDHIKNQFILWNEAARLNCSLPRVKFKNISGDDFSLSVLDFLLFIEASITRLKQNPKIKKIIDLGDEREVFAFFKNAPADIRDLVIVEYKNWLAFLLCFFQLHFSSATGHLLLEFLKANNFLAKYYQEDKVKELIVLIELIKLVTTNFFYPFVLVLSSEVKEDEGDESFVVKKISEIQSTPNFIENVLKFTNQTGLKTNISFVLKKFSVAVGNFILLQKLDFYYNQCSVVEVPTLLLISVRVYELYVIRFLTSCKDLESILKPNVFLNSIKEVNFFLDKYFKECNELSKTSTSMYQSFANPASYPISLYYILSFTMWAKHIRLVETNDESEALFSHDSKKYKIQASPAGSYTLNIPLILEVLVKFFDSWLTYLDLKGIVDDWSLIKEKNEFSKLEFGEDIIKTIMFYMDWVFGYSVESTEIETAIEKVTSNKNTENGFNQSPMLVGLYIQLKYDEKADDQHKYQYVYSFLS